MKLADCLISAEWPPESKPRFVGARYVDPGALVSANQPLLSVAELDPLQAEIYVIERDYPYLRTEQPAIITTDAYPGVEFHGRIVRIAQLLEDNTRQAAVRIEIANGDLRLKPGMFARVQLEFASRDNTTVVPRNAVVRRNGESGVFELHAETGTVHFVPVTIGISDGNRLEITAPELERPVITLGNHLLIDGASVIVPEGFEADPQNAVENGTAVEEGAGTGGGAAVEEGAGTGTEDGAAVEEGAGNGAEGGAR